MNKHMNFILVFSVCVVLFIIGILITTVKLTSGISNLNNNMLYVIPAVLAFSTVTYLMLVRNEA